MAPNPTGQGGSMARFTVINDFLYVVDNYKLNSFSITDPMAPELVETSTIGWDVETIFAMRNMLFIGTATGMHIYEINEEGIPEYVSLYEHVLSCDPVVAQDTLAYVTLRSETNCRGVNRLDILDISDIADPKLLHSKDMLNPHGLGISDSLLFITEGDHGLKVFDVNTPNDLEQIAFFSDIKAFDVIPNSNILIVTGADGIRQYDYSDPTDIKLLSTIPVEVE
ncbi:hypothetical protein E1176_06185 [Fulvivirga sp. RKSG066]|nr:hypothetical protein [Fulvivirga aurantia]